MIKFSNWPLAPRGHMTNAPLKQWVVILLLPKIDRTHKNYLTPKIWEQTYFREIFYGTLIFNKVAWFVLAAVLEGILLPSNMAAKTTFCVYLVKCLIVKFRCAINVTTSFFQHSAWSSSVIFLKSSFGHMTSYGLSHFKQMVQVWKTKSLLFCLRDDPLIVFWRQNHVTFIFIKTMSHDLLVQVAYSTSFHTIQEVNVLVISNQPCTLHSSNFEITCAIIPWIELYLVELLLLNKFNLSTSDDVSSLDGCFVLCRLGWDGFCVLQD